MVRDQIETLQQFIENQAKTNSSWKVVTNIIDQIYPTGKKATPTLLDNRPIVFDKCLPK